MKSGVIRLLSVKPGAVIFLALSIFMSMAHAGKLNEMDVVKAASVDFFASISSRNLTSVTSYLGSEGFTEFIPESDKLLQLNAGAFSALFKSGAQIDVRLTDIQVRTNGGTAIVTGTRVGAITKPGATPVEGKSLVTMIWFRHDNGWQLEHVHLSAVQK
ncbi:nuclear transport factor 2 family protein [Undibacterium sp. CY18W]|uniref:Nuclear transport factor 2 family protein n=1 Tax=Undibacterium hunanense TaxID=2762292 RepID=A0ABR6ZRQ5_9BURK|nr:nuclear transport factor 2 family protein [Undibacterium hunanense]MBC3918299.1 nuclear transport factor 2 family protein [Undibacterium hunanense]